ncbi:MAG: HK97 family phage prohead protease [Prevotella sp.]|jgi:HK97 family phage prohead protease|nr:HK97 family phage prohead protease [Prevotella sp.]
MTIFKRSFSSDKCALRALDDGKTIEGYAIVFNQRSLLVVDPNIWKYVVEVITPESISDDLIRSSDVICNINHDNNRLLARSVNGSGSLTLTKDKTGVKFSFQVADTPDGHVAYEGVKRGDFSGCSFAYYNDDDITNVTYSKETDENDNETIVRQVNKIDHLCDVSIVLYPAYPQTSVEARSEDAEFLANEIKRALPGPPKPKEVPKPKADPVKVREDEKLLNNIINFL